MTEQDILKRLYEVFIVNGAGKSSDGERCLYNAGVNGYGCAIGCLLPENVSLYLDDVKVDGDRYTTIRDIMQTPFSIIERDNTPQVVEAVRQTREILGDVSIDFLGYLQSAHDTTWVSEFRITITRAMSLQGLSASEASVREKNLLDAPQCGGDSVERMLA